MRHTHTFDIISTSTFVAIQSGLEIHIQLHIDKDNYNKNKNRFYIDNKNQFSRVQSQACKWFFS